MCFIVLLSLCESPGLSDPSEVTQLKMASRWILMVKSNRWISLLHLYLCQQLSWTIRYQYQPLKVEFWRCFEWWCWCREGGFRAVEQVDHKNYMWQPVGKLGYCRGPVQGWVMLNSPGEILLLIQTRGLEPDLADTCLFILFNTKK